MKKTISLFLLTLFMASLVSVSALAPSEEVISFDDFRDAITEKYNEYGVEVELVQTDPSCVYTKNILADELEKAEQYLKTRENKAVNNFDVASSNERTSISPFGVMPGTVNLSKTVPVRLVGTGIVAPTGTVKVDVTIDVDYQYNGVLYTSAPSVKVMSGTYMSDYIRLVSYSSTKSVYPDNPQKTYVDYTITCEFKVEHSIIGGSMWLLEQNTFNAKFYPFR